MKDLVLALPLPLDITRYVLTFLHVHERLGVDIDDLNTALTYRQKWPYISYYMEVRDPYGFIQHGEALYVRSEGHLRMTLRFNDEPWFFTSGYYVSSTVYINVHSTSLTPARVSTMCAAFFSSYKSHATDFHVTRRQRGVRGFLRLIFHPYRSANVMTKTTLMSLLAQLFTRIHAVYPMKLHVPLYLHGVRVRDIRHD